MAWEIVAGPREFDNLGRLDIDAGWAYDLERGGDRHTISVTVVSGRTVSPVLPDECRQAIRTRGLSAITSVLYREKPPRYLMVTTVGIAERDQ